MGFAFHLLIVNHKQNESIRKQNAVLEQYMSQIERITLAEERNRLSSELHDTVGHAYTSIIMGMETLRTELATEMGIQRLDSLLEMGRKSIEDVRGYLHQMDSPCQSPSLIQSLQNLGAEFQEHAQVNVSFRTFERNINYLGKRRSHSFVAYRSPLRMQYVMVKGLKL